MAVVSVTVVGHHKLGRVARAARYANDRDAARQLRRAMTGAAKPLQKAVRDGVGNYMPRSGGYAATMKRALRLTSKTKTSMRGAGVTIKCFAVGRKRFRDVGALEGGRLRHPFFGNRDRWYLQQIRPHFFTEPIRENVDEVQEEAMEAMDRVAARIARA